MTTLSELADQLDRLDPETAWKERVGIAEQMKALLGERQVAFERCYDALLAPIRIDLTGATEREATTLIIPGGHIREIVFTTEDPEAKVKLTSLYHGALNLLQQPDEAHPGQVLHRDGVAAPCRLPLWRNKNTPGRHFADGLDTVMAFQTDRAASVGVLFVRTNPAETVLRILAAADALVAPELAAQGPLLPTAAEQDQATLAELMAMGRPAHRHSLTLALVNAHSGQRETHLVGIVSAPAAVPRIVACYQPGQAGPACLNEIERAPALADAEAPRLTRTSVLTLSSEQLATLHEAGGVRHGQAWIRLIPGIDADDDRPTEADHIAAAAAVGAHVADQADIERHPRGGPLPTMPGYPLLATVIQHARGRLHAGDEPMDIARQALGRLAAAAKNAALDPDDVRVLIGYLIKAADSKGRQDLMQTQREMRVAQAEAMDSVLPSELRSEAPQEEKTAPTDDARIAAAAAAYRRWRTLALQPQVDAGELAGASAAWIAARDVFEVKSPAAANLQKATGRIDADIAEARRRPAQHPNQLPGAIRMPDKK